MRNVYLIAANTFKEAIRQKLMALIFTVALGLVLCSNYLLKLDLGHGQLHFIADFGSGALGFFGAIMAITASCQLIHSEIETKTLMTLRSKPMSFVQFVFGKICGVSAMLGVFAIAIGLATAAMLAIVYAGLDWAPKEYLEGQTPDFAGLAAYVFLQWVKLVLVAAMSVLICSLSSSLMFSIIVSFMVMSASMIGAADFGAKGDMNMAQHIAAIIFPDLHVFARSEKFIFAGVDMAAFGLCVAYGAVYAFAAGLLASYCFNKRAF